MNMRTETITKERAYALLSSAGLKPVLPYRGYASAISDTDRIAMQPNGELVLITGDTKQGAEYAPDSYHPYQPKTGAKCSCKPGQQRDNCPACEGTGYVIDFAAIRARKAGAQ